MTACTRFKAIYSIIRSIVVALSYPQEQAIEVIPTKRTLSHWSAEEKDSFIECYAVRLLNILTVHKPKPRCQCVVSMRTLF